MNWFTRKDDPVVAFKKQLMEAVSTGNTEALEALMKTTLDFPPKTYAKALERAIGNNQLRVVEVMLAANLSIPVETSVLRGVVLHENAAMFALLSDRYNFDNCSYVTENNSDAVYKVTLRLMKKGLRCSRMEETLEDMKKLLLERNDGELPPEIARKVEKLENKSNFRL